MRNCAAGDFLKVFGSNILDFGATFSNFWFSEEKNCVFSNENQGAKFYKKKTGSKILGAEKKLYPQPFNILWWESDFCWRRINSKSGFLMIQSFFLQQIVSVYCLWAENSLTFFEKSLKTLIFQTSSIENRTKNRTIPNKTSNKYLYILK